jgi:hypothetical protein
VQAYDVSLPSRPSDALRPRTAADGSGIADEHAIRDRPRTSSAARGQTAEERRPPARQRAPSTEAVPEALRGTLSTKEYAELAGQSGRPRSCVAGLCWRTCRSQREG